MVTIYVAFCQSRNIRARARDLLLPSGDVGLVSDNVCFLFSNCIYPFFLYGSLYFLFLGRLLPPLGRSPAGWFRFNVLLNPFFLLREPLDKRRAGESANKI
jgi:hypothetical protein